MSSKNKDGRKSVSIPEKTIYLGDVVICGPINEKRDYVLGIITGEQAKVSESELHKAIEKTFWDLF